MKAQILFLLKSNEPKYLDLSKAKKAPFSRKSPLLVISEPTVLRNLSNGLNTSMSVSKYTPPNLHIDIPKELNNTSL